MARFLLLFFFAALTSVQASYLNEAIRDSNQRFKRHETLEKKKSEVFFNVDLLVWDAREEGLEYAYKNTGSLSKQELTSFEPDSKFEPAFRIELGGFLPYDSWTLSSTYTFYQTKRNSSHFFDFDPTGTPGPGMIAVWTYPSAFANNNNGARFESAKSQWRLHTSFLDLAMSRPCSIATSFVLSPSFGIRSACIHQRFETNYGVGNLILFDGGDQVTVLSSGINMYSNSNNVGLFFGSGFKWLLSTHWNLFTDFSTSLLASHFSVKRGETDLYQNLAGALRTESIRLKSEYWSFRPQADLTLGLQFSYPFRSQTRSMCFRISAAYEAEMWWKQNQLLRYLDVQNATSSGANVVPTQGDLMLHGVNLETGFDF